MVRREALLDAGGWELKGGYEDWDLWMALAERGVRGVHVPVRHRLVPRPLERGCSPTPSSATTP